MNGAKGLASERRLTRFSFSTGHSAAIAGQQHHAAIDGFDFDFARQFPPAFALANRDIVERGGLPGYGEPAAHNE